MSGESAPQTTALVLREDDPPRLRKTRSEFLARLSHQLRTPLNSIIGFSELILDGQTGMVNPEQRECLNDVVRNAQSLLDLVNRAMNLARAESGRMEFWPRSLELAPAVAETVGKLRPLLVRKNHALEVNIPETLPALEADEFCLSQVLLNLLSNAIKFTSPGGRIAIEAGNEDDRCRLTVSDNGIGIRQDQQALIFEPFYRGERYAEDGIEGTGLGLAIARQLVELSGGTIWVDSAPGKGSRFHFTLPLARTGVTAR